MCLYRKILITPDSKTTGCYKFNVSVWVFEKKSVQDGRRDQMVDYLHTFSQLRQHGYQIKGLD